MTDKDTPAIVNPSTDYKRVHFAGLKKRLVAFGFDFLVIFAYVLVLLGIGIGITMVIGPLDQIHPLFGSPVFMDIVTFLVLILPVILYFTLQESSPRQATWGKRKAGIQVVNAGGGRLTGKRAFVRSLLKLLPWQFAHTGIFHIEGWPFAPVEPAPLVMTGFALVYVLMGAYAVSMLVSKNHRTPYDWIAGSQVIVVNKYLPAASR